MPSDSIVLVLLDANKMFYGTLTLPLYLFKLERGPLDETTKAEVFLSFRTEREASVPSMIRCGHAMPWHWQVMSASNSHRRIQKRWIWLREYRQELFESVDGGV